MIRHPRTACVCTIIALVLTIMVIRVGHGLLGIVCGLWVLRWVTQSIATGWTWQRSHHNALVVLNPETLPAHDGWYIGTGFRWLPRHAEILQHFENVHGALPAEAKGRGGTPALQAVGLIDQKPMQLHTRTLTGHSGIEGATRVGKSELLRIIGTQAIQEATGPVVVIDPKGGARLATTCVAQATTQTRRVAVLCPALPKLSTRFNPLSTCTSAVEIGSRIATLLPQNAGQYQFFSDNPAYAVQLTAHMQKRLGIAWSLKRLFRDTMIPRHRLALVYRYIGSYGIETSGWHGTPPTMDTIRQMLRKKRINNDVLDEVLELCELPHEKFIETHRNLSLAMAGLVTTNYSYLFEPNKKSNQKSLTWEEIERDNMVLIVLTNSLLMRKAANQIGRLVLQDLIGYAARRYLHNPSRNMKPITAIIDEVGEVAYHDLIQGINKTGEAGVRFVMAWQSQHDLSSVLGFDGAESLLANVGNRITLRLDSERAAERASKSHGQGNLRELTDGTTVTTHGADNYLTNAMRRESRRRQPLIAPHWFQALPAGEGYAMLEGAVYKFSAPLLEQPDAAVVDRAGYADLLALEDRLSRDDLSENTAPQCDRASSDPDRVAGESTGARRDDRGDPCVVYAKHTDRSSHAFIRTVSANGQCGYRTDAN